MPWACLRCGILGRDMGTDSSCRSIEGLECSAKQDYFLPRYNKPMAYTTALANFRGCIVVHGGLDAGQAHSPFLGQPVGSE